MDIKEIGVLVIGLSIAGGFAFGGIASYAGIVDSGQGPGQQDEFNATLPQQNYLEGSFDLGFREQRVLAARNDVVFISVFYSDSVPEHDYAPLTGNLSGRVFVQVVNSSESTVDDGYGVTEYPQALVVGGTREGVSLQEDIEPGSLGTVACDSFRSWDSPRGSVVGYCQQ